MKIFIASDHAGYSLKQALFVFLQEQGYQVFDCGCESEDSCDYPDFISLAAKKVAADPLRCRGIVLGGSGQGEAIVANKFKRVRAAVINNDNLDLVRLSRQHNNANVLSLGARFITIDFAKEAVRTWLETDFDGDRHQRRIDKIHKLEA